MENKETKKNIGATDTSIGNSPEETSSATGESIPDQYIDVALKTKFLNIADDADKKVLKELKSYTDTELKKIKKQIGNFTSKIKKDEYNLKNKLEEKIDNSKLSVIETLGIFVALFTFLSIDIQIMRSTFSLIGLLGFILLTLGALLFFVIILHILVVSEKKITSKFILGLFFTTVFIVTGIYFVNKDTKNNYIILDKKDFDKTYTDPVKIEIEDLKSCFKSGGWTKCFN